LLVFYLFIFLVYDEVKMKFANRKQRSSTGYLSCFIFLAELTVNNCKWTSDW